MKYNVSHTTTYKGREPISIGQNLAWLTPRQLPWQRVEQFELHIDPEPSTCTDRVDFFGNTATSFTFNGGYQNLEVVARSVIDVEPRFAPAAEPTTPWEQIVARMKRSRAVDDLDATQFVFDSPRSSAAPPFEQYARQSFHPGRPILDALLDLTARIHTEFEYRSQSTTVTTPIDEVFKNRRGVCQDFAHLQIAMLRSLGLPARYVSGYLRTIPPPGQPRAIGADASHAWLSVYCDDAGWIDVDPTNNLIPSQDHIILAWGRDYGDVPPLKGVYIGGGHAQTRRLGRCRTAGMRPGTSSTSVRSATGRDPIFQFVLKPPGARASDLYPSASNLISARSHRLVSRESLAKPPSPPGFPVSHRQQDAAIRSRARGLSCAVSLF